MLLWEVLTRAPVQALRTPMIPPGITHEGLGSRYQGSSKTAVCKLSVAEPTNGRWRVQRLGLVLELTMGLGF